MFSLQKYTKPCLLKNFAVFARNEYNGNYAVGLISIGCFLLVVKRNHSMPHVSVVHNMIIDHAIYYGMFSQCKGSLKARSTLGVHSPA